MAASLSVVIPAYNTERYVQDAVASVLRQSHPHLDVVVVDDGSSDATASRVEALEPEVRRRGHSLRLIRQDNRGLSNARNTGLLHATGEYVGFLDSDDLWPEGKVQQHLKIFSENPAIDLTFSWWRGIDEEGRPNGRAGANPIRRPRFADLILRNIAPPSSVIARREAIMAAGMFDERLPSAEDLDMWLRVACLRDGNLECVDTPLCESRFRDGQMTRDWRRMRAGWEMVMAKAAELNPGEFAKVEQKARAEAHRYWAYIAYEVGDYADARALLARAWRISSLSLAGDRKTWPTSLAVGATLLPRGMHQWLDAVARGAWTAQTARRERGQVPGHP